MTPEEYARLKSERAITPTLSIGDIHNPEDDRTLLWGYTCDRKSHHLYLEGGRLHLFVYGGWSSDTPRHSYGVCLPLKDIVPDKRLYPEACDFDTCLLLVRKGIYLPFTTWNDRRELKQYHGDLAPEFS